MPSAKTTTDYTIHADHVLGEGGMGIVCAGLQISLGRPVAVKIIRSDFTGTPALVERFRREAELLARVIDGNVVQVFGAGEWNNRQFYAMELVPGKDLARRLQERRRFEPAEILHIAEGVGRALRAAWRYRIVHRDIKPSNILVTPDGQVKVADFGLAKCLRGDAEQTRVIAGTSKYLSPEQGLGQPVDIRSDIYSLGVVLFELATSRLPFEGDAPTTLIYQHVHAQPPPPRTVCPSVPEVLEKLILRCLAKRPEDRPQTPEELLEAVRSARRRLGLAGGSAVLPALAALAGGGRRRRTLALAGVLALLAGVLAWNLYARGGAAPGSSERERQRQAFELALGLGDYATAMAHAEKHFGRDSPEHARARARFREGKVREWEGKAAEALERKDWGAAVRAYEVILEFADDKRKGEVTAGLEFCRDLATAAREEAAGAWERALAIYRRRLAAPGEHRAWLEQAVKRVSEKLERGRQK